MQLFTNLLPADKARVGSFADQILLSDKFTNDRDELIHSLYLDLPQTNNTLKNFGGESCGGTLARSFQESCNTTFGQIGLDLADEFVPGMEKFVPARRRRSTSRPQLERDLRRIFPTEPATVLLAGIGQGTSP